VFNHYVEKLSKQAVALPSSMNRPFVTLLRGKENALILFMGAILALIIIATAIISAFSMRENSREEWTTQLDNLTLVLAEQVNQTLYSANILLDTLVEDINLAQVTDERQFIDHASRESQYRFLIHKISANPLINVAAYVAKNGQILNYTRAYPAPAISIADRDYFLASQLNNGESTFYSAPIQNKTDNTWVFYLSRKVTNRNGDFLGLIVIGVSSEVFSKFYKNVVNNLGEGAVITLYKKDMTVMSRWPFEENLIAKRQITSPTAKLILENKLANGVVDTNEQGVRGMVAARIVKRFPFIVSAEVNDDIFMQKWQKNERWVWSSAIASLTILVISIYFLLKYNQSLNRELKERIVAQIDLSRAHALLETKVQERTSELTREVSDRKQAQEELARLNSHIAEVSHRAGMAEVANSVIHNVGNALNSINVAVSTINQDIRSSPLSTLPKIADMIRGQQDNFSSFIQSDDKGQKLPKLLEMLADQWKVENQTLLSETGRLQECVDHIHEIISRQQSLSGTMGIDENIRISDLINNCLNLYVTNFSNAKIIVSLNIEPELHLVGDRSKISQILINLIMNAEESLTASETHPKTINISSAQSSEGIRIEVSDNGLGIDPEVLSKLFSYGFTTKPFGHGLGLHASAIAANEMGGTLKAFSAGRNQGATFVLTLSPEPINKTTPSPVSTL
jgi:signal transduction histidine kinase